MISAFRFLPRPLRFFGLVFLGLVFALSSVQAHRPFEVTGIGRLQHGRLEFSVVMSFVMANFLLHDPTKPEAAPVSVENFDAHREALLRLAPDFYAINDGATPLRPQKILLALNSSGEPQFDFVYPLPTVGPMRVRVSKLHAPGPEGINLVRFYNDDEVLLGAGLLGPVIPATPELILPISAPVPVVNKP